MRLTSWYRDSNAWKRLQRQAMLRDFGWERSARRYLEIYAALLGERAQEPAIGERSAVEDLILSATVRDAIRT